MLGKAHRSIVPTGQHEPVEQVPDREHVPAPQLCGSAPDSGSRLGDLEHCLLSVELDLPDDLNDDKTRHDLGERCDLTSVVLTLAEQYFACASVANSPTLSGHEGRGQINQQLVHEHSLVYL